MITDEKVVCVNVTQESGAEMSPNRVAVQLSDHGDADGRIK